MKKKLLSIILTATILASTSSPVFATPINGMTKIEKEKHLKQDFKTTIQKQVTQAILDQGLKSTQSKDMVELLVLSDGSNIKGQLMRLGAKVDKKSSSVYVVHIPAQNAKSIANLSTVQAVGRDKILYLPTPVKQILKEHGIDEKALGGEANPNLEYDHGMVGMTEFWKSGYDGKGTKVAVIDTGVEPANEMLTLTTDGKIKIVDYKDFWKASDEDSEGDVHLQEMEVKKDQEGKNYIELGKTNLTLPNDVGEKILAGSFYEGKLISDKKRKIYHDVNNNGKTGLFGEKIPVIVANYEDEDKSNDKIFVDTNSNGDTSDEKPLGIYRELVKNFENETIFEMDENNKPKLSEDDKPIVTEKYKDVYNHLVNHFANLGGGKNTVGSQYNFVITEVEQRENLAGSKDWVVNLGFDGNGHGSHVAGDSTGFGYEKFDFMNTELKDKNGDPISDGTLRGSAPGAQVMALRVFQSSGGTPQSAYMAAMEYACQQGADVINMSLGSLPDLNDEREPSAILAGRLSKQYGTIFCISAGNNGPVMNSIGTPGTSEWAFTVGAYAASYANYMANDAADDLHEFSSRGPTEDGRIKPTIVAPGNMISASPMWETGDVRKLKVLGHTHMEGTSMASPYAAGVMASLKQSINEKNIPFHPLVLKQAVFETGKKDVHNSLYKPTEIGGGLIQPQAALNYLLKLKENGLTQNELKNEKEYIDRTDIILKTEFDYSEKLDYKPEGLFVRNGEIPSKVKVKITNTKNKDLNITLTKDSYAYKNDWLELPQNTLSLAAGESKELELTIDKNKLGQGVNSVIIRMDDEKTLLKEGFIPVTVVNYQSLSIENPQVQESQSHEIKLGGSDTHFVNVPANTECIEIQMQLDNKDDMVPYLVYAAEPSGITSKQVMLWRGSILPTWGGGKSKTGRIKMTIPNPQAGTWEISLNAYKGGAKLYNDRPEIMAAADGTHTMTVSLKGVNFEPSSVKYSGKAGEYLEEDVSLKLLNSTETDIQQVTLKGSTLVNDETNKKVEKRTIKNEEEQLYEFTIEGNNPNLITRFKTTNPQFGDKDDLDLDLYKVNEDGKLGNIVAYSGNPGSEEEIVVENLPTGKYALKITAFKTCPETTYDLITQIANANDGENAIQIKTPSLELNRDLKDIKIGLRLPSTLGNHFGFVYAMDAEGKILGKAKIEATVNEESQIIVEKLDVPSEFTLNEDGKITVSAKNITSETKRVTLITALYDKDNNKMLDYNMDFKDIKSGEKLELTGNLKLPAKGTYTVRCFVWDDRKSMTPYCKVIKISVK